MSRAAGDAGEIRIEGRAITLSETKRAEIAAILGDIKAHTSELARHGIDATNAHDVLDAIEIIQRMERKIIENMQAREAAE